MVIFSMDVQERTPVVDSRLDCMTSKVPYNVMTPKPLI